MILCGKLVADTNQNIFQQSAKSSLRNLPRRAQLGVAAVYGTTAPDLGPVRAGTGAAKAEELGRGESGRDSYFSTRDRV